MKKLFFLMCLFGVLLLVGCKSGHTTNLSTYGKVQNAEGVNLQGIAIITKVDGFPKVDTVYSDEEGVFFSKINKIAYPIPNVTVTAFDPQGVYQQQSKTPHYMYECGVGFVPENDCAFPSEEVLFILNK